MNNRGCSCRRRKVHTKIWPVNSKWVPRHLVWGHIIHQALTFLISAPKTLGPIRRSNLPDPKLPFLPPTWPAHACRYPAPSHSHPPDEHYRGINQCMRDTTIIHWADSHANRVAKVPLLDKKTLKTRVSGKTDTQLGIQVERISYPKSRVCVYETSETGQARTAKPAIRAARLDTVFNCSDFSSTSLHQT